MKGGFNYMVSGHDSHQIDMIESIIGILTYQSVDYILKFQILRNAKKKGK